MTHLNRIAFIGNSLPRHCGIATFTTDLQEAIGTFWPDVDTTIVAMTDHGQRYDYPSSVGVEVRADEVDDYIHAAEILNDAAYDVVCLQHEFGIFGGEAGGHVLALLTRLTMPVVTTFHTVLAEPDPAQRDVMERIVAASAKVVVMAEKARDLLRTVYRVPADRIEVIPHGIPDFPFVGSEGAKAELGFSGCTVILTFGLLSPNKGVEVMIDAMPAILKSRPDAIYVVLGSTHPNLVRDQGEAYRESLVARVKELGVESSVVFLDRFVDQATLLRFISMCDVYVTPYLSEAQMTSGTLAYSFGLGKPVVSTPYWHAQELLADGRGILVPFGESGAIGDAIAGLLTDGRRRRAMSARAYAGSRSMTWDRTAERYLAVFEGIRREHRLRVVAGPGASVEAVGLGTPRGVPVTPEMRLGHFLSMCDDTGLLQHAVHAVPDRSHGYCVDDNARALLLACALNAPGEQRLPEELTGRFAAFVQHAWNPDIGRFRNFMGFDRRWLEDRGSEDSHGRTLWALGECARSDANPSRRRWAAALFAEALPAVEGFRSPRAWAFTLLGLDACCAAGAAGGRAETLRARLADRLLASLSAVETEDWLWFEEGLAYDNARLSQALIVTGHSTGTPAWTEAGLRSLRWLMARQTAPSGVFRPVGTDSFGDRRVPPQPFDQQPLEAAATVSACLAAWRADGDAEWRGEASRAFAWFLGRNDLSVPLVDPEAGSCRDGLHRDRPNENRGGESVLSYLLSLAEIRRIAHLSGEGLTLASPLRAVGA
ncbi:glycosyltransferase family 4 protein [Azospirillum doebereinerae]